MENLEKLLKKYISEKRLKHSLNVAVAAAELSKIYGEKIEKARIAGILHDATKEFSLLEHADFIQKYGTLSEKTYVFDEDILHGFTGSIFAREIVGIKDEDILNSIKHHIVGRAEMSLLEKIIFISDSISQERNYKGVKKMRNLAKRNLDEAILKKLKTNIIKFSFQEHKIINPDAFEAYNYTINKCF